MSRIYKAIIELVDNKERLNKSTKVVVVTHAQVYQIFKNLSSLAKKINENQIEVSPGELSRLCFQMYLERSKVQKASWETNFIDLEDLCTNQNIDILRREISFLESGK